MVAFAEARGRIELSWIGKKTATTARLQLESEGNAVREAKQKLELRGIVYKEGDQWFAHCLELDVVAEGDTAAAALADVIDLCSFQIETAVENNDLESIFRPAPPKFWNLFFSQTRKSRVPKIQPAKSLRRYSAREVAAALRRP